ncbi:hypothetical protein OH687_35390 [Burkholderia anthina]|nr:hypothetical protein OH687_35390 [Burkholderia anthina]
MPQYSPSDENFEGGRRRRQFFEALPPLEVVTNVKMASVNAAGAHRGARLP